MSGQRGRFAGHAFHEVAVAADGVDVEVEQLKSRTIEVLAQPLAGHGHAHAVSRALAKRSRGGLDAGGDVRLGMAGRAAAELAETFDFIERDREILRDFALRICRPHSCQVEDGVQHHGSVSGREHKAVAVWPQGS